LAAGGVRPGHRRGRGGVRTVRDQLGHPAGQPGEQGGGRHDGPSPGAVLHHDRQDLHRRGGRADGAGEQLGAARAAARRGQCAGRVAAGEEPGGAAFRQARVQALPRTDLGAERGLPVRQGRPVQPPRSGAWARPGAEAVPGREDHQAGPADLQAPGRLIRRPGKPRPTQEETAMHLVEQLIGGARRGASNGATFERANPVTGEVATRAPAGTVEDAIAAVEAADRAFPAWAATSPAERRARLYKAAELMDARVADFIRIGVAETGGTSGWYGFNVMLAANMLREAAAMTTQIGGEVIPSNYPGSLAMAVRQPAGVVLGIAPWNAPVILGTRAVAVPLACGNTVVLKAAESCPGVHALIGEILAEAGLGDGVINIVTNAP